MYNKVWNRKISGLPGAICNIMSIISVKISNWLTTRLMIGNIKHHGKHILVMKGCHYRFPQHIEINDDVIIGKFTSLSAEICKDYDNSENCSYLQIGQGVSIGNYCEIDFSGGIRIGKHVHLAHHVLITTHDHGYDYRNQPIGKSLEIKEGAFIGSRCIILHNCNYIGKNAVIGTGSVVTKDVPDNTIVAGNPAKIIKYIL